MSCWNGKYAFGSRAVDVECGNCSVSDSEEVISGLRLTYST